MDGLVVQGEISTKILTLRGQQVMIDSPSTSSGTNYLQCMVTEPCRSGV